MAGKKRNPVVLKVYRIISKAMFIAWILFAINYCAPKASLFYNFSSAAPASYASYDDYIMAIQKYEQRYNEYQKQHDWWQRLGSRQMRSSLRNAPSEYGDTNIQVDGVNEGDVIKNDGKYLYILSEHPSIAMNTYPYILLEGTVAIVDAYPPGEMNMVSKIPLVSGKSGGTYRKYLDIYLSGQNLVILSVEGNCDTTYSTVTWADIYDVTDKNNPVHKRAFQLDGYFINSREQNGILYLFTAKNVWNINDYDYYTWYYYRSANYDYSVYDYYDYIPNAQPPEMTDQEQYIPYYRDTAYGEDGKQYVPADRLHTLLPELKENYSSGISTINVAGIDLTGNKPSEVSSYTYAGYSLPQLYMSAENTIYLMQNKWEKGHSYTDILKLSVDKTDIQYAASKKVPGYTHNQFSADEYKGVFRIATNEGSDGNNLFILDGDLDFISSVRDMAVREWIRAVRFDGDMGYIVTFENTDPVFVLDLSDSQSPKITGELKIPGYSTYLHPLGNGLLLGVGDDTITRYYIDENGNETDIEIGFWRIGIKASLFDVSDPYNPKETSVLKVSSLPGYTDIGRNHKSFMNMPRHSMFSFRGEFTDIADTERIDEVKKQALIISYDKDNGLKLVQAFDGIEYNYTNYNYYYSYYYSNNGSAMNRITYIENVIYHFDGDAVNAYDMNVTDGGGYIKIGSVNYK